MGKGSGKSLMGLSTVKEELYSQGFRPSDETMPQQNLVIYEKGIKRVVYDEAQDKILSDISDE